MVESGKYFSINQKSCNGLTFAVSGFFHEAVAYFRHPPYSDRRCVAFPD
jgi:hypothetical protein